MSSPAVRGFQLDASAIGDAQASVNLFRGDVNFPLKLVSLAGPNGLDLNLSALYAGAPSLLVDTWNLDAPTGVLGLGWSLPYDFIEFQHSGTASYLEGRFLAHINGRLGELVLVSWTNRGQTTEQLEFADPGNPLWLYTYQPQGEVWTVKRDDGVTLTFGDTQHHSDAVQWGVRWDNWAGNSQSPDGSPQQFGVAWNLAEVHNQWGNRLIYSYQPDEHTVAGAHKYTRASYIEGVRDAYGRSVVFHYQDKDPKEYQPPHTSNSHQAPETAYQDRYETKYLAGIDVKSPSGDPYYSIAFVSQPLNLGKTVDGSSSILTSTCKRYLQQVRQHRDGRDVLPPLKFAYDLKEGSISRGKVTKVTYPAGGSVTWKYQEQSLGGSDLFNLNYSAHRPQRYESAVPRLWFGPDYVVIIWYVSKNKLKLQVFEYGGRWAQEPYEEVLTGIAPASIGDVLIAFGSDFFAFYSHNPGSTTDKLFVFQKKPYQFGKWSLIKYDGIQASSDTELAKETSLVTGNDFIALHPGGTNNLYRFAYDRRTRTWFPDPDGNNLNPINGPNNETRMALAGQGNVLAVGFFRGTDDAVSVIDQVYWLDPGAPSGPKWQQLVPNDDLSSQGSFRWNSYYAAYMRIGAGFAVGTYLDRGQGKLHVTSWSRNFTDFSDKTVDGDFSQDNAPLLTEVSGSTIANGGFLYRYNGSKWVHEQIDWSGKSTTVSGDSVLATTLDGSGFDAQLDQYNPLQGGWNFSRLKPDNPSPQKPAPSQFGGRFLTIGANLFFKDTDGKLLPVKGAFDNSPGSTVACRGPRYIAYETTGEADQRSTKIALLLNGQVDGDIISLKDQRIGDPTASGTVLTGPTAFATYDNKYDDFRNVPRFTLHRILNRQVGGFPTDCVVAALDVASGTQTLRTVYKYDTAKAVFDSSGQVAEYPRVIATRQDTLGKSLGSTTYEYLNGLQSGNANDPLADCYSLASGFLSSVTEMDNSPTPKVVSSATNIWTGLTYTPASKGGFTKLSGIKVVRQKSHVQTLENLDVLDPGSSVPVRTDGKRTLTTTMEYVPETTDNRSKTVMLYGSDGQLQTRVSTSKYAWEVYDGMKNPSGGLAPMLSSIAQTTLTLNGTPVQAYVSTYTNQWPGAPAAWGTLSQWRWNGEGSDPQFNFAHPDSSHWLKVASVDARTSTGLAKLASNATGVQTLSVFDKSELWNTATIVNSDGSNANFTSFESYEPTSQWTGGSIQQGDAHTGNACVHVSSSQKLTNATLKSAAGQGRYLLSCFIKSSATAQAVLSLQVGSATAVTKSATATSDWQYLFVYAEASGAGQTLTGSIAAAGGTVLVDDVQISPVVSSIAAAIYDDRLMRPVASVGPNGTTDQVFYDYLLRPLGHSGPDNQMTSYKAQGYAVTSGEFNTKIVLAAHDGGPFDDFRDPAWQQRWTSNSPGNWKVVNKVLTHVGTANDTISLKGTDAFSNVAVHVQVMESGATASGTFGISIGSSLTAQWDSSNARWELLDAGRNVVDHAPPASGSAAAVPTDLLLIAGEHGVVFFVDQQQMLQHAYPSTTAAIKGAVQLFTTANGMGFAQVLVYRSPLAGIVYTDGTGRTVQTQQLADNEVIITQSFYDELGRATIDTKPATYPQTVFGYQNGFAQAPDPRTGKMTGYVNDYYNGTDGRSNDEGFPYSRKCLEYSTLGRVLESGQPGAALAIQTGNTHTTRYLYGTNTANPFFATAPAGQYEVNVAIDPDGLTSTTISDQLNNKIASVQGSVNNSERQQNSVQLDARDSPKAVRTPNFYAPPTGTASDWQQTAQYDIFGRLTESTSSDAHTTKNIYDTLGNLRFELIADGTPAAGDANPCGIQTAIRYRKYDILNRVTESGWVCVEQWNAADLQAKANQNWPPQNTQTWQFRYHYDGDGTQKNAHGHLTSVQTLQANGDIVTETFEYDLAGKVLSRKTSVPKVFSQAVRYQRNHSGKVTKKIIPSLTGGSDLTLNYAYDPRGLVANVGSGQGTIAKYTWDAAGNPVSEVLGDSVVHRKFTYTASGHPATIAGNRSAETFHYYDGTGTPRYNGLPSALTFRFADAPEVTWTIAWDNFQRMTGVSVTGGAGANQSYHYDANGNVTTHNDTTFAYKSGTNQVKSISGNPGEFTYTPAGKTVASPSLHFRYNFNSGLVTDVTRTDASGKLSVTFGSSAQRLVKSWTGAQKFTRQYLPGTGGRSLVERTEIAGSSPTELRYVFGPLGLVAMQSNETDLLYVVRDHEQSVRQVVTSKGDTAAAFNYLPFGRISSEGGTSPNQFIYRYTGQEWDAETSLYNYRHRLYDPHTRRFLSPDPAQQYFSPYLYVGDNPLLLTDPTGEFSFGGFSASLGTFFGGVAAFILAAIPVLLPIAPLLVGAGIAGIGGGVAGMGYSVMTNDKNFKWSQWAQAEAGGAIGAEEIAAGVMVTILTDGAGWAMGGATLIGAGFSGLMYSTFAGSKYDWIDWTIQEGVGALAGLITGGFGAAGGAAADFLASTAMSARVGAEFFEETGLLASNTATSFFETASAKVGVRAVFGGVGGISSSMVGNAIDMGAHHKNMSDFFSAKNLVGDFVSLVLGVAGAGIGGTVSKFFPGELSGKAGWLPNLIRDENAGWSLFVPGVTKRIPQVINPFMFNSKKLMWPAVPNWGHMTV